MKKIISLSGLMGSGKDTVASILIKDYGYVKLSFSKALKDMIAAIFGWERALLEGDTNESRLWRDVEDKWWTGRLDFGVPITPRWVLQHVATEVMRQRFHPDIWILAVEKELAQSKQPIVITDARFFNELSMLRYSGARIVGVHRRLPPNLDKFYRSVEEDLMGMGYSALMHVRIHGKDHTDNAIRSNQRTISGLGAKHCHLLGAAAKHQSEWEHLLWNNYDTHVANTGTLQELRERAIALPF
jgi:hypothetical protein